MGVLTEHLLSARIDASSHVTICGYIVQSCGMTPTEATRLTPDEDHMIWAAVISAGRSYLLSALRFRTHKLSFQANVVMIQSLVMEALNERRTFLAERRAVFAA